MIGLIRRTIAEHDQAFGRGSSLNQAIGFAMIVLFLAIDAWAVAAMFEELAR